MAALAKMAVVGIGSAVVAYLFDPERGKGRRARLADQTEARLRRFREEARRRAEFQSNRIKGLTHEIKPGDSPSDLGDETIRQKVKSEVIGPAQLGHIDVQVRDGVVTLSSEVEESLTNDIKKVAGVVSVEQRQAASPSEDEGRA